MSHLHVYLTRGAATKDDWNKWNAEHKNKGGVSRLQAEHNKAALQHAAHARGHSQSARAAEVAGDYHVAGAHMNAASAHSRAQQNHMHAASTPNYSPTAQHAFNAHSSSEGAHVAGQHAIGMEKRSATHTSMAAYHRAKSEHHSSAARVADHNGDHGKSADHEEMAHAHYEAEQAHHGANVHMDIGHAEKANKMTQSTVAFEGKKTKK